MSHLSYLPKWNGVSDAEVAAIHDEIRDILFKRSQALKADNWALALSLTRTMVEQFARLSPSAAWLTPALSIKHGDKVLLLAGFNPHGDAVYRSVEEAVKNDPALTFERRTVYERLALEHAVETMSGAFGHADELQRAVLYELTEGLNPLDVLLAAG